MSIPGIPQENIVINEQDRLITITVPKTLPSLEITPVFTVNEQVKIYGAWGTGKKSISFANYCPCVNNRSKDPDFDRIEDIRLDNATNTGYYKVQLVKAGKQLKILLPNGPVNYELGTKLLYINFPVENYYGSSFIQYIAVTKTGSEVPHWIGGGDGCFDTCENKLNEIGIHLSGYLIGPDVPAVISFTPGYYDLDLRFFDETEIHIEKAIFVK